MANYVSTRVKELNIGISSYSASKTSLDVIGGAVISGVTTLASAGGITTTGGDLYVGGDLYIGDDITFDEVNARDGNFSGNLSVTGLTTTSGLLDVNNRLDVVGGANIDQLNVSGVSTLTGLVAFGDTATFGDHDKIKLGDGADLQLYHSGSHSFIKNSGGDLRIGGDKILLKNENDDEIYLQADSNGSVSIFHNNIKRLESTSSGVDITDTLNVAGVATFSSAVDLNATLDVDGDTQLDDLNVAGVATFSSNVYVGSGITMYASAGIVSATKFFGDGSGLENTGAALAAASGSQRIVLTSLTSGTMISAATDSDLTYNGTTDTLSVGSAVTMGASTGVVSATTYHGNQVIGTPTGGSFRSGAYTPTSSDFTKDSIDELNYILGKLVPDPPDNINGVSISLTGTAGNGRLCAGFTPTNNTGGSAPSAGTQYTRNTDSTVTTTYLTEYGPGDSGTVTGFVNAVGVGTTTLTTGDNDGTYGAIQIANNEDASNSTRNTGISSQFYEIYDLRMINAASPDGYNLAKFTQGSSTTGSVYWYEDPSTVSAPVISFSGVTAPSSPTVAYSSGIPHYTEAGGNAFTYVMTVTNASGDMYSSNGFVTSDGATTGFTNPGTKNYTDFASGTNPPARNYGVGSGVTCLISQTPNNVHATITSNHFARYDCTTPYGSDLNERVSYSTNINIMGTTADYTNNVDENAIECTVGSLTGGSATRVKAGATGDNPTATYVSWTGGSVGSIDTYEAAVRGGDLRHDTTDYSSGYLPAGPDYSSNGASQYFQFQFIQASISEFQITYTGSLAGCWVCMPDNSTWTTSLSGKNGWADMFTAYKGSGVPTTAEPGCASGGVMDTNGGTFTCVFGTESSSNDSNNRVLIRFKLTSGNSISDISLSDT